MSNDLLEIGSAQDLEQNFTKKAVLLFCADWHEATQVLKRVLGALVKQQHQTQGILFGSVDAENVPDLADKFAVTMVPTLVLLNGGSNSSPIVLEKIEGVVEPSQVTVSVQRLLQSPEGESSSSTNSENQADATTHPFTSAPITRDAEKALNERLNRLIHGDTVMLFMKGTPTAPRCGFSRQAVELLNAHKVPFGSFDVLSDEDVRQGLKTYSDWPTYPQIYVKGELVGGLDILKETAEEGSLIEQWELEDGGVTTTTTETLQSRLEKLVKRHKVMLFMKGLPSAPRCGFSRQIVEILDDAGVAYDAFNILEDEQVRQGLKEFSDWPTYPQLYVNGELVGGLDIVKELKDSNELDDVLKASV